MSKKQQVMEALLTSNVNLEGKDLMWIASHLPADADDQGANMNIVPVFKHEENGVFEAIGVERNDVDKIAGILADACKNVATKEGYNLSNGVEEVFHRGMNINGFFALLIANALRQGLEKVGETRAQEIKTLKELLKNLKKLRGDEDADDDDI